MTPRRLLLTLLAGFFVAGSALAGAGEPPAGPDPGPLPPAKPEPAKAEGDDPYLLPVRKRDSIDEAIRDGFQWLADNQQPDGSWGTGLETRGTEIYSRVPGSHSSFKTASTALAVMALQMAGGAESDFPETYRKGLHWLTTDGRVRRDQGDMLYNVWAHTYVLEAMANEMLAGNKDPQVRATADYHLDRLLRYETVAGGWNYYDFEVGARRPASEGTSFGTAATLVALQRAKEAGMEIPERTVRRALERLREARLPNGAFLYNSSNRYHPRADFNMWQGAAARSQAGAYALWAYNDERTTVETLDFVLTKLDENHIYLNIARKRPFPHEALYQNSGYYYYFGHHYAAHMVEDLPPGETRLRHAKSLADKIMPYQEGDGSWWDYAMWDFHKPYGTGYALMSLMRIQPALEAGE